MALIVKVDWQLFFGNLEIERRAAMQTEFDPEEYRTRVENLPDARLHHLLDQFGRNGDVSDQQGCELVVNEILSKRAAMGVVVSDGSVHHPV